MTRVLFHEPGVHDVGRAVLAIGVFDGVHIGHRALIGHALELATARHASSVVLTFDRDPDQVVQPHSASPQLTTLDDKLALLETLKPDAILVVGFDEATAALSPEGFLNDVVLDTCSPVACVVGQDFRFGARASGDVSTLRSFGAKSGFDVVAYDLVHIGDRAVTSSRIRRSIASGDVGEAATLLGRPHLLRGTVEHGRGLGRAIGVPTANLDIAAHFALPAPGVYASWATVRGMRYPAAVSVGVAPTFPEATCLLEAHLIGFNGDLYGALVTVEFVERLREQRAFPDNESLASAIRADIDRASEILAGEPDAGGAAVDTP
jgi:riboflavin kinase/FMN adenylyltransferase